ncbi:MAG: O-antigen ligase family protein [Terracidiphilus sp.]
MATTRSIVIPKRIHTVLLLAFSLNVLFFTSSMYSPSRIVSAAYSILYFLTLICVYEFILDIYKNPMNLLQCIFHLRMIALLLLIIDFAVLIFKPEYVTKMSEAGVNFSGGTVGPVVLIFPMIAIISAYTFLHSLESRVRSAVFFFIGLAGSFSTRSRGVELALLFSLAVLGYFWAKIGRYTTYMFISGFSLTVLLIGMLIGSVGGGRIWTIFNRGQDIRSFESASGRTEAWSFVIRYCLAHPWGMGYVAGFRILFRSHFSLESGQTISHIGNAHNTYLQVLADAGWLAFAIYLIMLVKIVRIALRFANKQIYSKIAPDSAYRMTIECSLLVLVFFLASGTTGADFAVPLRAGFYWQFIIIAIILGISAKMLALSRTKRYFGSVIVHSGKG